MGSTTWNKTAKPSTVWIKAVDLDEILVVVTPPVIPPVIGSTAGQSIGLLLALTKAT